MPRWNVLFVLQIVPRSALTHGMGSEGNQQVILRRQINIFKDGEWRQEEPPAVSGAALKATLREHAVTDALLRAGVEPGQVSKDALRFLLKGGKNDKGGGTVSLDEARRLMEMFPLIEVFGSMDAGLPIHGKIKVSDVLPFSESLVNSGLIPREYQPLKVSVEGEPDGEPQEKIVVFKGMDPIPDEMLTTEATYYRHDQASGHLARHYLEGATTQQIEDKRQANALAKKAGDKIAKEDRREANESMPHSFQAITAGTPLVAQIRLEGVDEVAFGCLLTALARWIKSGGWLGGANSKGHGACSVSIAGVWGSPLSGADAIEDGAPIMLEGDTDATAAGRAYDARVRERAEQIRAYVAESTR